MGIITNITYNTLGDKTLKSMSLNESYEDVSIESITQGGGYSFHPFGLYEGLVNSTLADEYDESVKTSYMVSQQAPALLISFVMSLHMTFTPVLCVLGIVGNSLCVGVFLHDPMRGLSVTVYMVAILLGELVYLLTLFHEWLTDFRQIVDSYQMGGWCQFITMMHNASTFVSQWCVLSLVLDRYISTCWPEWEPKFSSPVKAKIVCVSVVIVAVIIYLNLSMIHGEYHMGTKHYCLPLPQYKVTHQTLSIVEVFVNSLLLYFLITSLTCLIVAHYLRQRARSSHPVRLTARSASAMVKHTVQDSGGNESERSIFCIFMAIYLTFTLPAQCIYIYNVIYNLQNHMTGQFNLRNLYLERVFLYIQYGRVLLNFPVLIIGYQRFRYQLKLMLKKLVGCFSCCPKNKLDRDTKLPLKENGSQRHQYLSVIHRDCESQS